MSIIFSKFINYFLGWQPLLVFLRVVAFLISHLVSVLLFRDIAVSTYHQASVFADKHICRGSKKCFIILMEFFTGKVNEILL